MENRALFQTSTKALLVLISVCVFLAVFATVDMSEHYRAWKTALRWTDAQKSVAPANDAGAMYFITLIALTLDTAIIAVCFACGLMLGISVAADKQNGFSAAQGLGWVALGLGLAFSAIMITYQILVGRRLVLKGPIFDYDLSMQPPIAIAVGGYPLSFILYLRYCLRNRKSILRLGFSGTEEAEGIRSRGLEPRERYRK